MYTSNKTSLKSVWVGSEDKLEVINTLAKKMTTLISHATHFMKYFAPSNAHLDNPSQYFEFTEKDCTVILHLLD